MLNSTSKYAIKALVDLAHRDPNIFISIQTLAKATKVPEAYLSKIFKTLTAAGIVESRRGVGGGIKIKKKSINFYRICEILDDPIIQQHCLLSKHACDKKKPCPYHSEWKKERESILRFLKRSKIA